MKRRHINPAILGKNLEATNVILKQKILSFHLLWQLVKLTRRRQRLFQKLHGDPVIHHLEKPHRLRRMSYLRHYSGAVSGDILEVDDWNTELGRCRFSRRWIAGGKLFRGANEDWWEFGDAGVNEAFDSGFGFIKSLQLSQALVDCGISGPGDNHCGCDTVTVECYKIDLYLSLASASSNNFFLYWHIARANAVQGCYYLLVSPLT
ncbi:hypothetical protein Ahy_B05g074048 [Arachis hypogaea]|uniref:Uncharacterized protein n=1 Tax=Arachis hypogaea TaxID=3818 RepID=A0A444YXT1_ARAHY|nr:hypothetical protein Ahy_B05g074048 [Arachis hypogaea]